jgi:hypothetical protein
MVRWVLSTNVLVIVCGGATATVEQLQAWDTQLR